MYAPPRIGKVEQLLMFWFWMMYPPPHPGMEKLKSQVNVTFWFWLMYPPPRNRKVQITGQCDILVQITGQCDILVQITGQCDILVTLSA